MNSTWSLECETVTWRTPATILDDNIQWCFTVTTFMCV